MWTARRRRRRRRAPGNPDTPPVYVRRHGSGGDRGGAGSRCVPSSTPPTVGWSSSWRPRWPPVAGRGRASSPASSGWRGTRGAHRTGPVSWWRSPDGKPSCPETVSALRSGELSLDQVAVVAAHTPARYEGAVAAFARSATVSQLRRTLRHHHFGVDPPEAPGREPNGLTQGFDGDGRYRLRAVLDADEGAIVRQALQEAHDALFRAGDGRVSGADALGGDGAPVAGDRHAARSPGCVPGHLPRPGRFVTRPSAWRPGVAGSVAASAAVRRSWRGGRGPPRPAGRLGPVDPDRADPAAAADRGARSRVSGAGVHGDAGADPPPPPLGGRRHDRAVEPGVAVPPSPSPAPRWRPADRRRPRAARWAGVRRSLRPPRRVPASSRRGRVLDESRASRRPSGSPARGAIRRASGSRPSGSTSPPGPRTPVPIQRE